ncbi:hypothetical protein [Azospirillum argentinense]|nr:hypothetical protein [Azospirillum argentinense]
MPKTLKSYAALIGRARHAVKRFGRRRARRVPMEHLDLGLFQSDIRL